MVLTSAVLILRESFYKFCLFGKSVKLRSADVGVEQPKFQVARLLGGECLPLATGIRDTLDVALEDVQ